MPRVAGHPMSKRAAQYSRPPEEPTDAIRRPRREPLRNEDTARPSRASVTVRRARRRPAAPVYARAGRRLDTPKMFVMTVLPGPRFVEPRRAVWEIDSVTSPHRLRRTLAVAGVLLALAFV